MPAGQIFLERRSMSKLSVHVSGPKRTGFGEYLAQTAAANSIVPVVFALNQNVWGDVRVNSPSTKVIYRDDRYGADPFSDMFFTGSLSEAEQIGFNWVSRYAFTWSLNMADYYSIINEPGLHTGAAYDLYNAFHIGAMKRANQLGLKLALYDWSSGTPDLDLFPRLFPSLVMAKAGGHLLALHEYSFNGGMITNPPNEFVLRYRKLRVLLPVNARCDFVITEAGPDSGYGAGLTMQPYIDDVAKYDAEVMRDPYVLGVCLFDLGNTESNIAEALPLLTTYTIAHSTPPVVVPPPPVTQRGAPRVQYARTFNVIPDTATEARAVEIFLEGWRRSRETAGGSYDDAGIGDLDRRVANLYDISIDKRWSFTDFYNKYYPGVEVVFRDQVSLPPFKIDSPIKTISFVVTNPFNAPADYANHLHEGLDLRAYDPSTMQSVPVYAVADGVVVKVNTVWGINAPNYGQYVIVEHHYGDQFYRSWYCHLSFLKVSIGQTIKRGDVLGIAGNTGTTSIHLHLNIQHVGHGLAGYFVSDVVDPLPLINVPVTPPSPPPLTSLMRGLQMRADGGSGPLDFQCITNGHLNAAKIMSNTSFEEFDHLCTMVGGKNIVFRMFAAPDNPVLINPAKFFDEHKLWLGHFAAKGGLYVEIHNEPNLPQEGFGHWWINGDEFGAFYASVAELIHMNYPTLKAGYPGLSPNTANEGQFIDSLKRLILAGHVDWIGAHAYWIDGADMNHEMNGRHYRRFMNLGKSVIITEFANVWTDDPDLVKGQQYKSYYASLEAGVVGAFAFVSSASDETFNVSRQTWVRGGVITDIVRGVV
jgi:murein DD-endopeptidase MepM/ murein hydrolase activator NlpD